MDPETFDDLHNIPGSAEDRDIGDGIGTDGLRVVKEADKMKMVFVTLGQHCTEPDSPGSGTENQKLPRVDVKNCKQLIK